MDDQEDWQLLFSPIEFNELHRPLNFQEYSLQEQQLRQAAIKLTQFRKKMLQRSELYACEPSSNEEPASATRSRKGMVMSVKSRDKFGISQRERADEIRFERHRVGNMKKRTLHELDADERVELAKLYLEGTITMAAVASKHHIDP